MQGGLMLSHAGLMHHKRSEKRSGKKNIYLTFTMQQWQKVEKMNEDEVRINGKMFDVKSLRFSKGRVIVYGHYDGKEDQLLAKAKDEKKKNELKKNQGSDHNLFFEDKIATTARSFPVLQKKNYPVFIPGYYFQYNKIENPPPRAFS